MKIVLYILGGIAALATLAFVVLIWAMGGANLPSIPPRKMPVPDGFDASLYQDIADLQSVDGIEVVKLAQYGEYFENYYRPDDGFVWFMLFDGEDGLVYLTVDTSGEITGVQHFARRPRVMEDVLLSSDGYHVMSADGFSDLLPYVEITGDISEAEIVRLNRESSLYHKSYWTDAPRDSVEFKNRISQHIMLHDGTWKTLKSALEPQLDFGKGGFFTDLATQYRHTEDRGTYDGDFPSERFDLSLTYFDQQEYFGRRNSPMGSTTGQGRPAHWRGTGYYSLTIGDDVLRFRIENDTFDTDGSGYIYLTAESHQHIDFMFLAHNYGSQKHHAYLFRGAPE